MPVRNDVRIDLRERDKSLSCKETLTLGSICRFMFYRDGESLPEEGYAVLRIPKCAFPGSPPGPYGLGAFHFRDGDSGDTEILKEPWLVERLRYMPVGTVVQLSMTIVTGEGVCAEGFLDVLIATVAEIKPNLLHDPGERVAMFRGERGHPGIELVDEDPAPEMNPSIRAAINVKGVADVIREVPTCPKDATDASSYDSLYVLVALANDRYAWARMPKAAFDLSPGDLPGKIVMEKSDYTGAWELRQKMMKWNDKTMAYQEDSTRNASIIYTDDHVAQHSDGVL